MVMQGTQEIHELILSAVDLLSMAQTFDKAELEKIFDRIESTCDGNYRVYLNAVRNMLFQTERLIE